MTSFKTNNKEFIKVFQKYICLRLPSDLIYTKKDKNLIQNIVIIRTYYAGKTR